MFTDGCGNIGVDLMLEINAKFGLNSCKAFQIRIGGIKGVLMYKRNNNLDGGSIEIRDSMRKFESSHKKLSIIRCATYS